MTHQNGSNDLASILQVLSSYAPPQATMQSEATELEEGEYDPNEYDPKQHQLVSSVQYSERQTSPTHHQLATPKKSVSDESKPPVPPQTPSPASIKTWPQALLHAVTYVCPNPEKTKRIQHLMDTQHQHERQWWEQRQEIIRKAKGRDASRVRLDSVLSSLGGVIKSSDKDTGEDETAKELSIFDRKVHKACRDMVESQHKELGDLGVPFFGTDIIKAFESQKDLNEMQSKMINFLETILRGSEDA